MLKTKNDNLNYRKGSVSTGWVIGIVVAIVVIALVVVFWPNIRDVENDTENGTTSESTEMEESEGSQELDSQVAARHQARSDLATLQEGFSTEQNYEEAAQRVAEIRADLAMAYENAEGSVRAEWQELDVELENLEAEFRAGAQTALGSIANLIFRLQLELDE